MSANIPDDLLSDLNRVDSVVSNETGWSVAALRSFIAEEYNHDQAHKPYSSLVMAHARIARLESENKQLSQICAAFVQSLNPEAIHPGMMRVDNVGLQQIIKQARAALQQATLCTTAKQPTISHDINVPLVHGNHHAASLQVPSVHSGVDPEAHKGQPGSGPQEG